MNAQQILQKLISLSSVSGHEAEIKTWIYDYLQRIGHTPEHIQDNVICKINGVDNTKAIILNGHVDTVDAGNLEAWEVPPLAGETIGDRTYGLGASDMKSGIAVMLLLAQQYQESKPPADIWLHFVVKEETTGQGTKEVMMDFSQRYAGSYQHLAGILLEPTDLESVKIAHKGNIFLLLTTRGEGGHGSEPGEPMKQAVKLMMATAEKLDALIGAWGEEYADRLLGKPTIVLTSIQAGSPSSPNKIAETCTATFDLRTTPAVHDKALSIIKQAVEPEAAVDTVYDPLPCGYTPETARIVQVAKTVTGLPVATTSGSTDMLFFSALNIPAIIFGPGAKAVEHKPNEYVELAKVDLAAKYVIEMIKEF